MKFINYKTFFVSFGIVVLVIILASIYGSPCRAEEFQGHTYTVCYDRHGYEFREHSFEWEHPSHNTTGIGGQTN